MSRYLLIESRSPLERGRGAGSAELASDLSARGHTVTVFLVQNGVLGTRPEAEDFGLAGVARRGVEVLADEFSLRERGIPAGGLRAGISAAALDVLLDRLAAGDKAIWC